MPKAFRKARSDHTTTEMNRRWEKNNLSLPTKLKTIKFPTELSSADWLKLPLKLRQRWWAETNFGQHLASEELQLAIKAALGK